MRKLLSYLAAILFLLTSMAFLPQSTLAAFAERPVGFVVMDHTGDVDGAMYKSLRSMVKMPYHFPDYKIIDGGLPQQVVSDVLRDDVKVDKKLMAALTEKSKVDVLVVARIYAMDERMVHGWIGSWEDNDTYIAIEASADFFVYKKDGNKFLKKRLREREVKEMGNSEDPRELVKWALSDIVNDMEGRPRIGS